MKVEQYKPPSNWTDDELTSFIQTAVNNIVATFNNKRNEFDLLKNIDNLFQTVINSLLNTPDPIAALLLIRGHSAYRGACRMSLSGQVVESFVLLRSCLECSLYALHVNRTIGAGDKWINRHKDEKTLKIAKLEFTYANVANTLESIDPWLSKTSRELYERAINFGAHPNERGITSSLYIIEDGGQTNIKQLYLVGDSLNLMHGLKSTAQIGLCSLYILRHAFKERFDLMGVTEEMDKYRSIL